MCRVILDLISFYWMRLRRWWYNWGLSASWCQLSELSQHPRPPPTQSDARYSSPSSCFISRIIVNNDKLACIVLAGACLIALINPTWGDRGEMIILWCAACVAPTSRGWCPGHLMNWSRLFASWAHLRWSAAWLCSEECSSVEVIIHCWYLSVWLWRLLF